MSTLPYTTSEVQVFFKYKQELDAEVFNSQYVNALGQGITYVDPTAPLVLKLSDSSVQVNKFAALVRNNSVVYFNSKTQASDTKDLLTKVDIRAIKTLTGVTPAEPYIVLEFLYTQSNTVVPSLRNLDLASINPNSHIILGKCKYDVSNVMYDIDIEFSANFASHYNASRIIENFTGYITGNYSLRIKGGLLEGTSVPDLDLTYVNSGENLLTTLDKPALGYHRFDFVHVDSTNQLVVIKGQEEIDTGNDETPEPDKIVSNLYPFPIIHIYVSGKLRQSDVLERNDLRNIRPIYLKRTPVNAASLSDLIILDQIQCDAYLGSNSNDDQGGNTPGIFGDGFPVEYNSSVKTVYLPNLKISFKNQFDSLGNPIPYQIHNRLVLGTGTEIDTANNVTFELTRSYAGWATRNQTNWIVDTYSASQIKVLSENTKYIDAYADNYLDQVQTRVGDKYFSFNRDTDAVNRKHTVTSILKTTKEEIVIASNPGVNFAYDNIHVCADHSSISNINSPTFHGAHYEFGGQKKMVIAYANPADGNKIYIKGYKFNTSTRELEQNFVARKIHLNVTSYSEVKITITPTHFLVVGNNGGSLDVFADTISDDPFTAPSVAEGIENSTGVDRIAIWTEFTAGSNLHIVGVNASEKVVYLLGVWNPTLGSNFDVFVPTVFSAAPNTDATNTTAPSIVVDGSKKYITFGDLTGGFTVLSLLYYNGTSWTKTTLDNNSGTGNCAYASKLDIMDDPVVTGGKLIFVSYNFNTSRNKVKFGRIDLTGPTLVGAVEVFSTVSGNFVYVDFKINTSNKYSDESTGYTNFFNIIAFNQNTGTGQQGLYVGTSIYPLTAGFSVKSLDLVDEDNSGSIAMVHDDYIYIAYYNAPSLPTGFDNKTYLLRLFFQFEIGVTPNVPVLGLTDLTASFDYVENVRVNAQVSASMFTGSSGDVFNFANSINSFGKLEVKGVTGVNGLNGNNKTFADNFEMVADETNSLTNNISGIQHSSFSKTDVAKSGSKNFNSCYNINVSGSVEKVIETGSGDYNL